MQLAKFTLVIGAGVAGLSIACEMMRRGRQVMVIDRGPAGAESTWAGGGILAPLLPWDYPETVTSLAVSAMQAWADWVDGIEIHSGLQTEYRKCGMLALSVAKPGRALSWCKAKGVSASLSQSSDEAIWLPEIAQVRNPRLVKALRTAFLTAGGHLYESPGDFSLLPRARRVQSVQIKNESHAVEQLVLATGAWAGLPLLGMNPVPNIRPIRGQMLLYTLAPGTLNTILYRQGLYIIPRQDGHVLVGSTLEDVGFDKTTDVETARHLHRAAAEMLPALANSTPLKHWAGLRPGSPDNIPVIGRHPDFDNVFVNVGHYRYGLTMAPAAAELLADLMEDKTPTLDPAPYSWAAAEQRRWTDRL